MKKQIHGHILNSFNKGNKMSQMSILLSKLISLNAEKFKEKLDKGGSPYILHCLRVMLNVTTSDIELQCIAISHDLIEDIDVTYKDLQDIGCSDRVIEGIRCLTKIPGETKEEYLSKVLSNKDACLVKLSDLKDNSDIHRMKGLREKDFERLQKYHFMYDAIKRHLSAN
jgi:(p)ppGpp synthase/HD superfamily hydrolase